MNNGVNIISVPSDCQEVNNVIVQSESRVIVPSEQQVNNAVEWLPSEQRHVNNTKWLPSE